MKNPKKAVTPRKTAKAGPRRPEGGIPVHCAHTRMIETTSLRPHPQNPNRHPKKQIDMLAKIIREHGWRNPIVVSTRSGYVVKGHGRLAAAIELGEKTVPVDFQEYPTSEQELADLLADNRIAELAETDDDALIRALENLRTVDLDLELAGFDKKSAEQIMSGVHGGGANSGNDDTPAKSEILRNKWGTETGQRWLIGKHVLFCGDSTKPADLALLFRGERAACVYTDPPYGVSYEAQSGKFEPIKNDELRDDALTKILKASLALAVKFSKDTAAFYIWHASSTRDDFSHAIRAVGLIEKQYIIWVKHSIVLGHADYQWAHEPCFYCAKDGQTPAFYGDRSQSTVWRAATSLPGSVATTIGQGLIILDGEGNRLFIAPKEPKNKKVRRIRIEKGQAAILEAAGKETTVWEVGRDGNALHPTQKPVELARRAIENSTMPSEIVFDPFLGSGTTLISAEENLRICYGMEIDPGYVAVCLERAKEIGLEPTLE